MSRPTARRDAQPQRGLLDNLDVVDQAAFGYLLDESAFVQHELDVAKQILVVFGEMACTESTACLFVGHGQEHEIARKRCRETLREQHRHELDDASTFVVDAAPSPDKPIAHGTVERRHGPFARGRGYDVHVMHQDHGAACPRPGQARQQVAAAFSRLENPGFDAVAREHVAQERRRSKLVSRRIDRVDAYVLLQETARLGGDLLRLECGRARTGGYRGLDLSRRRRSAGEREQQAEAKGALIDAG